MRRWRMLPLCDSWIPLALVATGVDPSFTAGPSARSREIVFSIGYRRRRCVSEAWGKTALQFGSRPRSAPSLVLNSVLGRPIDFEGKNRIFGSSIVRPGHSQSIVMGGSVCIWLR